MSNPPERPWTEEEKVSKDISTQAYIRHTPASPRSRDSMANALAVQYTLLTEILKKAGIPSSHLVRIVRDFSISPSWADIPLPPGTDASTSCPLIPVSSVYTTLARPCGWKEYTDSVC